MSTEDFLADISRYVEDACAKCDARDRLRDRWNASDGAMREELSTELAKDETKFVLDDGELNQTLLMSAIRSIIIKWPTSSRRPRTTGTPATMELESSSSCSPPPHSQAQETTEQKHSICRKDNTLETNSKNSKRKRNEGNDANATATSVIPPVPKVGSSSAHERTADEQAAEIEPRGSTPQSLHGQMCTGIVSTRHIDGCNWSLQECTIRPGLLVESIEEGAARSGMDTMTSSQDERGDGNALMKLSAAGESGRSVESMLLKVLVKPWLLNRYTSYEIGGVQGIATLSTLQSSPNIPPIAEQALHFSLLASTGYMVARANPRASVTSVHYFHSQPSLAAYILGCGGHQQQQVIIQQRSAAITSNVSKLESMLPEAWHTPLQNEIVGWFRFSNAAYDKYVTVDERGSLHLDDDIWWHDENTARCAAEFWTMLIETPHSQLDGARRTHKFLRLSLQPKEETENDEDCDDDIITLFPRVRRRRSHGSSDGNRGRSYDVFVLARVSVNSASTNNLRNVFHTVDANACHPFAIVSVRYDTPWLLRCPNSTDVHNDALLKTTERICAISREVVNVFLFGTYASTITRWIGHRTQTHEPQKKRSVAADGAAAAAVDPLDPYASSSPDDDDTNHIYARVNCDYSIASYGFGLYKNLAKYREKDICLRIAFCLHVPRLHVSPTRFLWYAALVEKNTRHNKFVLDHANISAIQLLRVFRMQTAEGLARLAKKEDREDRGDASGGTLVQSIMHLAQLSNTNVSACKLVISSCAMDVVALNGAAARKCKRTEDEDVPKTTLLVISSDFRVDVSNAPAQLPISNVMRDWKSCELETIVRLSVMEPLKDTGERR